MSNRPRRPHSRHRVHRPDLTAAVRLACRLGGCTCDVWLTMVEIEPGIYDTKCEHDDDCPLWIKRRALWN